MSTRGLADYIEKGFAAPPLRSKASGSETLHRIFGGACGIVGSYFFLEDPASVSSPEFDAAIAKWSGPCVYVARFRVGEGTTMHVGRIDWSRPDGAGALGWHPIGDRDAPQVWIDLTQVLTRLVLIEKPRTLLQTRVRARERKD